MTCFKYLLLGKKLILWEMESVCVYASLARQLHGLDLSPAVKATRALVQSAVLWVCATLLLLRGVVGVMSLRASYSCLTRCYTSV